MHKHVHSIWYSAVNPVILLVKVLLPGTIVVLLELIVGFGEVLQQIPISVISVPPSFTKVPSINAVEEVISETLVVATTGGVGGVSSFLQKGR